MDEPQAKKQRTTPLTESWPEKARNWYRDAYTEQVKQCLRNTKQEECSFGAMDALLQSSAARREHLDFLVRELLSCPDLDWEHILPELMRLVDGDATKAAIAIIDSDAGSDGLDELQTYLAANDYPPVNIATVIENDMDDIDEAMATDRLQYVLDPDAEHVRRKLVQVIHDLTDPNLTEDDKIYNLKRDVQSTIHRLHGDPTTLSAYIGTAREVLAPEHVPVFDEAVLDEIDVIVARHSDRVGIFKENIEFAEAQIAKMKAIRATVAPTA